MMITFIPPNRTLIKLFSSHYISTLTQSHKNPDLLITSETLFCGVLVVEL